MAIRQKTSPNLGVTAYRGWCLAYVDDAVNAPARQPSAQASFNLENKNGNVRGGEPPVGLWVPIFFSLNTGPYAGLGHVAWAFNHGNGWVEIHDTETQTGARAVYRNIAEVLAWFGKQAPKYLGYSYWVDGAHVIEDYTPAPTPGGNTGLVARKGTAKVLVDALNVRNAPDAGSAIVAVYGKGQVFNYDHYQVANGYVWLSYVSNSGVRRWVAEGPNDGNDSNVWVSGGV